MVVKINSRKMQAPLPQKDNAVNIVCVFTVGRHLRWLVRIQYHFETPSGMLVRMCPSEILPVPASEQDWFACSQLGAQTACSLQLPLSDCYTYLRLSLSLALTYNWACL